MAYTYAVLAALIAVAVATKSVNYPVYPKYQAPIPVSTMSKYISFFNR